MNTKYVESENGLASFQRLITFTKDLVVEYPSLDIADFVERMQSSVPMLDAAAMDQLVNLFVLEGLSRVSMMEPDWTFFCTRIYLQKLYAEAANNRGYAAEEKYGSLHDLLENLTAMGIYHPMLLEKFTKQEIQYIEGYIQPEHDNKFTYIGLRTLADRYLVKDHSNHVYELPQERFIIIAMTLMINEPVEVRLKLIKEAYWALSNLYMTVATPTLANAGKSFGQLSSCFIDTVDDSLRSIYDSNTDVATLSKNGGGIGVYLGKIRSRGSAIKGFKGMSSGVLPWMKQLNNTAISVDQLGQRKGAVAVYLDVFHKDIFHFLDARLNNGDERQRTHDLFTGVVIPDLFMEQVEKRAQWYLFDPHEVRQVMGYSLEDYYDEKPGEGTFRSKYWECVDNPTLSKEQVSAIEVMKRIMISQLETGTPYLFYRDTVNRDNPNKQEGMIYCSNLCTEIMQNMSPTSFEQEVIEEGKIIVTKAPGDFVVCNLSSINLGKTVPDQVLERLIPIQVRMLDNVIDLNTIPVLQAALTNKKYRAIGLGTFGWHHLLALKGLVWESTEAVSYADQLYEKINYLTIKASMELSMEKGQYPAFQGSDWHTGQYFERKGYVTQQKGLDWDNLKRQTQLHGLRNGYLLAVAPNSSTSIIAGSTASIDPIFKKEYAEEKKDYRIPVVVPDLNEKTNWYYKSAYHIDQVWSVRQNAARQKHVDQSISFNIYVTNDIQAKDLLHIHMTAWKSGLKSTYYVRSTSSVIEECESCTS